MQRFLSLTLFGAAALALALDGQVSRGEDKKDEKPAVLEIDGMKASVPAGWKEEKPENLLRYKQFKLPKMKDDTRDAEIVIFKLGGTAEENVKRWKGMFLPPDGKTIEEVSKVSEIKIGDKKATQLDIYGTFLYKKNPMEKKAEERPDHRMIAIQYDGGDASYQIRLVGPAATVEHYKKGFDDTFKSLKK